jgi:hypothetical protein
VADVNFINADGKDAKQQEKIAEALQELKMIPTR